MWPKATVQMNQEGDSKWACPIKKSEQIKSTWQYDVFEGPTSHVMSSSSLFSFSFLPFVLKQEANKPMPTRLNDLYSLVALGFGLLSLKQWPGNFWALSVNILVILNPTGYMLTSFSFSLFI